MTAVSDASPLCYLILIHEVDLLRMLFRRVVVPTDIITELLHDDAPEAVRHWAGTLPPSISVHQNPVRTSAVLERLQSGERAAILLAESISADVILLDEKSGRRIAANEGCD